MKNLTIGCHLSTANGFEGMAKTALSINANTFQYFTRNPRGGKAKKISESDIRKFKQIAEENKFGKIVSHASYTMNLCSSNPQISSFSREIFADDIKKTEYVPENYYNLHPGSHTGQGVEIGIKQISDAINLTIKKDCKTTILLETMAGKGSEVGGNFDELSEIIKKVNFKEKIGICLDTCHIFDAGYDVVNNLEGVLENFDNVIGMEKLKVIHFNDSKNPLGSHKDRHEIIGKGHIGIDALEKIINHPSLKNLPFILETPNGLEGYKNEIDFLKKKYQK